MSTTSKPIYAIAFQVGWFVCILAGSWISLAYAVVFMTFHFWASTQKNQQPLWPKEILWITVVLISGFILETLSFSAGFLYTEKPSSLFERLILPPLWLLNLWIIFAIALRTCLSFVFYKPKITYLLSFTFIPLNYCAGAQLNTNVTINSPCAVSLALIALLWVVFLWTLNCLKHNYFEDIFNAS